MKPQDQKAKTEHDKFQLGNGLGSGEKGRDAEAHKSKKQFGDNPLPKSGGGYANAGNVQPNEEAKTPNTDRKQPRP